MADPPTYKVTEEMATVDSSGLLSLKCTVLTLDFMPPKGPLLQNGTKTSFLGFKGSSNDLTARFKILNAFELQCSQICDTILSRLLFLGR